jgi:dTDP-glucose 4,6-dehydratase
MAEHLCALYASQHGLETKIARCFAFVGPYLPLDVHFAIGNFIRDALNGGPIVVKGDGAPYRSYLYAADLAIWLWTILVKGESCRPYNVGSDHFLSIREIAESVSASFRTPIDVQVLKPAQLDKTARRYVPAILKARDGLALQVRIDLKQGIKKTVRWHQDTIPK